MAKEIKETSEQLNALSDRAVVKRVIACAGSGKTRVITSNIIKVLNSKICRPDEVLALTFTRNAAENMRIRINEKVKKGINFENIDIFTFNSFGNEIISENSFEVGLGRDFRIIDSSQSWQILYEILGEINLNHVKAGKRIGEFVQNVLIYIENLKNNLISTTEFEKYLRNYKKILSEYKSKALKAQEEESIGYQKELFDVYLKYEKKKYSLNCIDYSDQVFIPYFLLLGKKSIRIKYQQKYKYIFVDEFQDTNIAQAYLLSLLGDPQYNKLMVVGDDDQGIYSFRGACVENILNFHKWDRFKNCCVSNFYLTTNFRSGTEIINTVNNIISSNKVRFKKELKPEKNKKDSAVVFYSKKVHKEEAAEISKIIKYLSSRGIKYKDMAILARRKRFGEITQELEANGIKFELVGGKSFFFEPEILFIVSWLRVINNITDEISVIYLLKSKKYKICDRDIYFLKKIPERSKRSVNIIEGIMNFEKNSYLSKSTGKRLENFLDSLRLYIRKSGVMKLKELISLIIEDTGMMNELKPSFGTAARSKIKNIENLIRVASDFQESYLQSNLESFITYLKDVARTGYENPEAVEFSGENSVKVMSIHAAKGLEFEVVFLPMLWKSDYRGRISNNRFKVPSWLRRDGKIWKEKKNFKNASVFRQALREIKLEEERRIFYVACSRAKKVLVLSYSEYGICKNAGNDSGKVKEILPFFNDVVKKGSNLKIINQEGLKFIKLNYGKDLYNNVNSYDDAFSFIKSERRNYKTIKMFNQSDWKKSQEILVKKILEVEDTREGNSKIFKAFREMNSILELPSSLGNTRSTATFFPLTQILDYIRCPLIYKWRYINLIPQKPGRELQRGEEVHKFIENITLLGLNHTGISKNFIMERIKDNEIRKYTRIFLESRFWQLSEIESMLPEQLFYWKINNYFITGKLDRIDVLKDGKMRIVDYKVSSGHSEGKESRNYYHNHYLHSLQLKAYMGAVSEICKVPVGDIGGFLLYLKDGTEKSIYVNSKQIEDLKLVITNAIINIRKGDFKSTVEKRCDKNCSYTGFCTAYKSRN